jgi:hypothetical protein
MSETATPTVPRRIIGIRHRIKRTAQGEARPTQVYITSVDGKPVSYDLEDEQSELDFVMGIFPIDFRDAEEGEDVEQVPERHRKGRSPKVKVACAFDGLREGDVVAVGLGGSGDRFTFALSKRGEAVKAAVFAVPPADVHTLRTGEKDGDAKLLTEMYAGYPDLFTQITQRERDLIAVREAYHYRMDAMKERVACEQRLRQRFIGAIFCNPDGLYPSGSIEMDYDARRANDPTLKALKSEEARRIAELTANLEKLPVYTEIFSKVEGCGPAIASRIIAAVGDVKRFATLPKFKAYCGVGVPDGKFMRRQKGSACRYSPDARQALYLLADQFNKRPDSHWGQRLLAYKEQFRNSHPDELKVPSTNASGKPYTRTFYTKGHIHRMACWRTATKFIEWLYRQWMTLEDPSRLIPKPRPQRPRSVETPLPAGALTDSEALMYECRAAAVEERVGK